MHWLLVWITLYFLYPADVHGGKVLVCPAEGSHWVNMNIIIEELHSRGHQVFVLRSSDSWYVKETSPFYTPITINMPCGFHEDWIKMFVARLLEIQREGKGAWARFKLEIEQGQKAAELYEKTSKLLEYIFDNPDLMQSLRDAKYDLVLTDPVIPSGVILAHYLSLPLVFNVRWTTHNEGHFDIAPSPLSYVPVPGSELSDKMTFLERVTNMLFYGFLQLQVALYVTPQYAGIIEKYFGPDVDYFSLFQVADLWLMRVDFVFEFPRPTMPNVVYMG
ncbi:hypothetical protein LDENG_00295190, partial [Lucifuga dentata]